MRTARSVMLAISFGLVVAEPLAASPNVTVRLHDLGIPYATDYPAPCLVGRNIWDMAVHDHRLYMVAGSDCDDRAVGPNYTGVNLLRTRIRYLDLTADQPVFPVEFQTHDNALY